MKLTPTIGNGNGHNSSRSSLQSSSRCSNVSSLSASSRGHTSWNSVARSSITSTKSLPPIPQLVGEKNQRRSLGQQATLPELSPVEDGIHLNAKPQRNYWCTVCKRHFQTSGGWIKHEKESHEKTDYYVCMPDGSTLETAHGSICELCGTSNPDAKHLEEHNIQPCLRKEVTDRKYTRRYQLQKHLESHNVRADSSFASRWRRGCVKQAWACGFCVTPFAKAKDRFNHIVTKHYDCGEDISNWDPSKVILGLLQQPRVHGAWARLLEPEFPDGQIDLRWDRTPSKSLITMLELATEDGADLARVAFIQSDYHQSRSHSRYTAITPIEGTKRGTEINRRGMQSSHRLHQDSHNSEQNPKNSNWATPDNSPRPGWPHQSGLHLPQAIDDHTGQHREVPPELPPRLNPSQIIHSSGWPKAYMFDPSSYEIQSTSHPEQSTWPDPVSFGVDYASHCEPKNTSSSIPYMTAPLFGEVIEGQWIHPPIDDPEPGRKPHQQSFRNNSKGSISPSSQNKHPISKFWTLRSQSPMEVDLDLESFGGVQGNEETIFEAQLHLWDQDMNSSGVYGD